MERLVHLKGSEGQVKKYFVIFCDGLAERHKDHVVDAKQRDEQECGLGEPPERETVTIILTHKSAFLSTLETVSCIAVTFPHFFCDAVFKLPI